MDAIKHHRRSIRLASYDYGLPGAYFVTVCAAQKRCVFGSIENGIMRLNPYGRILHEEWLLTATLRPEITLDEFVIMPNHFHAIVIVGACGGTPGASAPQTRPAAMELGVPPHAPTSPSRDLGAFVNGFKGAVTRRINTHRAAHNLAPVHPWQRNYYERIIRTEKELQETRRYLLENPSRWSAVP